MTSGSPGQLAHNLSALYPHAPCFRARGQPQAFIVRICPGLSLAKTIYRHTASEMGISARPTAYPQHISNHSKKSAQQIERLHGCKGSHVTPARSLSFLSGALRLLLCIQIRCQVIGQIIYRNIRMFSSKYFHLHTYLCQSTLMYPYTCMYV